MTVKLRRGDIYQCHLDEGTSQKFLIIQNDIGNKYCQSLIVVPLTKNLRARKLLFTMLIEGNSVSGLDQDYVALFYQIRTLAKSRFQPENRIGRLENKYLPYMDDLIKLSLGLSTLQRLETQFSRRITS